MKLRNEQYIAVYKKREGYFLVPFSYTTEGFHIATEPFEHLALEADFPKLGKCILKTLRHSNRRVVPHPRQWSNRLPRSVIMFLRGRTWASLQYGAYHCSVKRDNGHLTITPWRSVNFGRRGFVPFDSPVTFTVPEGSPPEKIGKAVDRAFGWIDEND
jgi:hypothetical protein